jgi:hypothetical protein
LPGGGAHPGRRVAPRDVTERPVPCSVEEHANT